MANKRLGQDAKCLQAGSINTRSKQSSQKKTSLNAKFDALLNWQHIFCDSNCGDEPFDDLLLNVLHVKNLLTKIVLSYLT